MTAQNRPHAPVPSQAIDAHRGLGATDIEVRVRYTDCDPMGVAHHSVYPVWLEIARTELLRQVGLPYRQLETRGVLFVVARLSVRYRRPARYDDLLRVCVWQTPAANGQSRVKVEHEYEVHHGPTLLATAATTLVCVDRQGRPQTIPPSVFGPEVSAAVDGVK